MKIEKFWVVTKPKPESGLSDVCFETDAKGLVRQVRGGLAEDEIHAIYNKRTEAEKEGKRMLRAYRRRILIN